MAKVRKKVPPKKQGQQLAKGGARLMKSDVVTLTHQEKVIEFYRNNPVEAARDILGLDLTFYQRIQLRDLWNKPYCLMKWGRGSAKTWEVAMYVVLRAILFSKFRIGIIGPGSRQTGYVFDEIETLYAESAFFRAATLGGIKRTTERSIVKFANGSFIEGLPIGTDGSKIRGRRYNVAVLDEFAFHNEETIKLVVRPFLAVKRGSRPNQLIMCSTPYYTTNHFYKAYLRYKQKSKEQPDLYSCTSFNFLDVILSKHKTFQYDINQVYEAFQSDPWADFLMEWAGYFPSDDANFFNARLISSCEPRIEEIELEQYGEEGSNYIMGIDPARSEDGDNFAITLMKITPDHTRHITRVVTTKGKDAPSLHNLIREQIHTRRFNVIKICMDYGGGGKGIADLMTYGWKDRYGKEYPPIVEIDAIEDEIKLNKKEKIKNQKALNILNVVNFTNATIDYMYTSFKADLEHKKILMPLSLRRDDNSEKQQNGLEITLLKAEMIHLVPVVGTRGINFEPSDKKLGKDRITSAVLANYAYHLLYGEELANEKEKVIELPVGFWF